MPIVRESAELAGAIEDILESGRGAVLATVIEITGSAYRRQGAKLVIGSDGDFRGMISGGCLEPEVARAASRVFKTGQAMTEVFDLTEDAIWGLRLGCGGVVRVLLEPIGRDPVWGRWLGALKTGERAVRAVICESDSEPESLGRWLLVAPGEPPAGPLAPEALGQEVVPAALEILGRPLPQSRIYVAGNARVFLDVNRPPLELVVFGAGVDAVPVVRLALSLGFSVNVVDPRPSLNRPERFPGARTTISHPTEFPEKVAMPAGSYALIMNHQLDRDGAGIRYSLESGALYVGVLGPRPRFQKLMDELADEGFRPGRDALDRIHNPVGLDIGAEGPEQIAVSILAEILAVHNGFGGGFLAARPGGIHEMTRTP
ncbi:MAG: XdhC family protein [Candidatus Aminicenantes bacterium]|nr:XdhC family protein [Candidatus Aminicenantes bacterium]